jgi:hypothetical protein
MIGQTLLLPMSLILQQHVVDFRGAHSPRRNPVYHTPCTGANTIGTGNIVAVYYWTLGIEVDPKIINSTAVAIVIVAIIIQH